MSHRYWMTIALVVILLSGCTADGGELNKTGTEDLACDRIIVTSGDEMEYLEQDPEKWFLYDQGFDWNNPDPSLTDWSNYNINLDDLPWDAEQWMHGGWHDILQIERNAFRDALGDSDWVSMYNFGAEWIYYLEPPYTWNELEFPENKRTLIKGVNENIIDSSWLPSIYRQFFTLKKVSSGTLSIWVIGEVDVYMDPPFGTRLLSNDSPKPRCFLGRGVGDGANPTKITISIPEIKSGTHCLYFVHRAAPQAEQFAMMHMLSARPFASQTSDGGWHVEECDCSCLSSNSTAEYLVHDINLPNGNVWEPLPGTTYATDYALGKWEPVHIIPYHKADNNAWGRDYRGTPWHTLYNKCASWIYTVSDPMDEWNNCRAWETNIYRQVFSVDKDCNANLIIYSNDLVDVYADPFIDLDPPYDSTPLISTDPASPQITLTNPYHVGTSVHMHGGRMMTIPIFLPKGSHTLYFVHKNQYFPRDKTQTFDYYGVIYTLCCKEECKCDDE